MRVRSDKNQVPIIHCTRYSVNVFSTLHLCTRPGVSCWTCAPGQVSAAALVHEVTCQLLHFCMRPRVSCCTCARGHVSSDALVHEATCQLLYLCTRPRVCCCTCWCPLSLTLGNGHAYRILSLSMRIGYHCQPIVFPHVFPAFSRVKKISTKHSLRIYIKKNRLHSGAQKIRCTEQNKQTLTTTFTTGKQYCYIEYSPKRNTKLGQQNTKKTK